ncbi:hypothetical protein [Micromonospora sp. HK10]|uniref:hypothetical protein n=1 Tax=Micromonospora sp. HK10 TaxID=1538294 RepID=UPI00069695B4|nr:hypothetical protein [Micromonospora sp. HK10]
MNAIDQALSTMEREWRAYGVRRQDRATLAADLRLELQSAAADGVTPEQLLDADLRGFARRLADEAGVSCVPPEYGRVVRTALTGTVLGGCVGLIGYLLIFPLMVAAFDLPRSVRVPILLAVLVYYGSVAALAAGGAVVAVRTRLGDLPRIRRTASAMLVLLPLAGAAAIPLAMGFARAFGYTTDPLVVAAEVGIVVAAVVGAVLLARWWSVRDPGGLGFRRRQRTPVATDA